SSHKLARLPVVRVVGDVPLANAVRAPALSERAVRAEKGSALLDELRCGNASRLDVGGVAFRARDHLVRGGPLGETCIPGVLCPPLRIVAVALRVRRPELLEPSVCD